MPELPEVETMRRGIAPILGTRIDDVWVPPTDLRPITLDPPIAEFRRKAVGHRVVGVGRVGKRVVIEIDSGDRIVVEPRMTGRLLLSTPPDERHLRLVVAFSRPRRCPGRLLFWDSRGLGVVRLLSPQGFARRLGPAKLGPDALEITAEQLRARLGTSRRAIKVALMDQSVLAGVGNLYASEVLHRARVHPAIPCRRIRSAQWRDIHAAIRGILCAAIDLQGSTLADGMYRTVQGKAGGFQGHHLVYQRAGQNCRQCEKAEIVRIVQSQRSTFYCPHCQRRKA